jgi:acyl CoA:acetate/3-ketoacid CoA transferase beta subunit
MIITKLYVFEFIDNKMVLTGLSDGISLKNKKGKL